MKCKRGLSEHYHSRNPAFHFQSVSGFLGVAGRPSPVLGQWKLHSMSPGYQIQGGRQPLCRGNEPLNTAIQRQLTLVFLCYQTPQENGSAA